MELSFDSLYVAVWVYDIDNANILWANKAALMLWDSTDIEELSARDLKSEQSDAVKQTLLAYQQGFYTNKTYQETWHFTPNNKEVKAYCRFSGYPLDGNRMGMLVEALRNDALFHSPSTSGVMVALFSASGQFVSANPPFQNTHDANLQSLNDIFQCPQIIKDTLSILENKHELEVDAILKTRRGNRWCRIHASASHDSEGRTAILLHNYDIHERKIAELAITKQAKTDPLTGLLNRFGLTESVKLRIRDQAHQENYVFALFYLDLDGFKMVNDSFGHAIGDLLLVEVADRLRQKEDASMSISRFGGDEFVLFVESLATEENISLFCNELQNELAKPFQCIPGQLQSISASIGCALYPEDGLYFDQLISRADAAMYFAKKEGRKQHRIYLPKMELALKRASSISSRLMTAIRQNILSLNYQMIMNLENGKIDSFEALLRWHDDQLGHISPEEIIQIAEKTGLIQTLEHWVFRRALTDLHALRQTYGCDLAMSVNMSGAHLAKKGAGLEIGKLLSELEITGTDLRIELTEATFVESFYGSENQINDLIQRGVGFSIDDFGTGYSSLAYLHKIPATTLKVDRAFVKNAKDRPVILECILNMAADCNMVCVAEGVETQEESEYLKSLGYHLQQGYLFSKPLALDELVKLTAEPRSINA